MTWLLDSYAIVEMIRGNPNYRGYRGDPAITILPNLAESYYVLAAQGQVELATICVETLSPIVVPVPISLIPPVMDFRRKVRGATGERFSYADAFGYSLALLTGCGFLTGAHEFRGFPSVEFVR